MHSVIERGEFGHHVTIRMLVFGLGIGLKAKFWPWSWPWLSGLDLGLDTTGLVNIFAKVCLTVNMEEKK